MIDTSRPRSEYRPGPPTPPRLPNASEGSGDGVTCWTPRWPQFPYGITVLAVYSDKLTPQLTYQIGDVWVDDSQAHFATVTMTVTQLDGHGTSQTGTWSGSPPNLDRLADPGYRLPAELWSKLVKAAGDP